MLHDFDELRALTAQEGRAEWANFRDTLIEFSCGLPQRCNLASPHPCSHSDCAAEEIAAVWALCDYLWPDPSHEASRAASGICAETSNEQSGINDVVSPGHGFALPNSVAQLAQRLVAAT